MMNGLGSAMSGSVVGFEAGEAFSWPTNSSHIIKFCVARYLILGWNIISGEIVHTFFVIIFWPWSILWTFQLLVKDAHIIAGKGWWSEIEIEINHICHFCSNAFAVLVHVNCVKFSSENDTKNMKSELKKYYFGIQTSRSTSFKCVLEHSWRVY